MIGSERKRRYLERFLLLAVGCCILAHLGILLIMNVVGFERFCNADMYADTLLAKYIWEQKSLFPPDWIFSNQFFVVGTPVLTALFYGLTGNVNTAMVIATEIMTLLILLSFLWLMRAFTKELLYPLFGCLLLLASVIAPDGPNTMTIQIFYVQASYYACYLITMFVVFGDYVRAFQSDRRRIGTLVLAMALSFATGMHSLRQTLVMVLPILAYEVFLALRRILQKEKLWSKETGRSLIRAACYTAANLAGVAAIELIDPLHTTIYGSMELVPPAMLLERIPPVFNTLKEVTAFYFAFDRNYSPWFLLFWLFLMVLVVAAAVLWLIRIHKQESPLEQGWALCLIGVAGVFLSCVLISMECKSIYFFPWFPLVAFSGIMVLQKLRLGSKCVAVLLSCLLSLGCLYHSYVPYIHMARGAATDGEQLCQWAMDEGYDYVYGHWFVSPRVAVYSGGELEAAYWWNPYETLTFNLPNDIYDEEANEKAIYVFTPDDEEEGLALASERGVTLTKVAEFGDYRAYTSPVPLMDIPIPGQN